MEEFKVQYIYLNAEGKETEAACAVKRLIRISTMEGTPVQETIEEITKLDQGHYNAHRPEQMASATESWICPNDETVNSGDTCIICGFPRPEKEEQTAEGEKRKAVSANVDQPKDSPEYQGSYGQEAVESREEETDQSIAAAAAEGTGTVGWVCPDDGTYNTGVICTYCGQHRHEEKEQEQGAAGDDGTKALAIWGAVILAAVLIGIWLWSAMQGGASSARTTSNRTNSQTVNQSAQNPDSAMVPNADSEMAPNVDPELAVESPRSEIEIAADYARMISAGQYHSVALKGGKVIAKGQTSKKRCDTDGWSGLVAVSAYSHTVGLKSDGTVVAAGDWTDGRCDVSGWKDITDIDTGEKNTIGLKKNGTVVVVGSNEYHQTEVSGWTDIVDVAVGNRTAYGVKRNGSVVAAGGNNSGQKNVEEWKNIVAISAGSLHVVGLRSDGTVIATGNNSQKQCEVDEWKNIVAVSAGNNLTVGVKNDGSIVYCGSKGNCKLEEWANENIVAVSVGADHVLALTKEGKILVTGMNAYGKTDIAGNDLF